MVSEQDHPDRQAERLVWEKMTSTGVVLRLDGRCQNSHPSLTNHIPPTRHTGHPAENLQVTALSTDFAWTLAARPKTQEARSGMVGPVGLEPTTYGLKVRSSAS